jgi:hypothetical protein
MAAGAAGAAAAVELLELLEALEPPRSHGKHAPAGTGAPPVNGMVSPANGTVPPVKLPAAAAAAAAATAADGSVALMRCGLVRLLVHLPLVLLFVGASLRPCRQPCVRGFRFRFHLRPRPRPRRVCRRRPRRCPP